MNNLSSQSGNGNPKAPRRWSAWDSRGRCVAVGTAWADSDAGAIREALAGGLQEALERAGIAPAPGDVFRVKAGAAMASAAWDELEEVAGAVGATGEPVGAYGGDGVATAEATVSRRKLVYQPPELPPSEVFTRTFMEELLEHIQRLPPLTGKCLIWPVVGRGEVRVDLGPPGSASTVP